MTEANPAGLQKLPLVKAVSLASRVAARRSPLPIVSSVLLTPEEGAIRISGTNLESRIEAIAEGSLNSPICVPASLLRNALTATQAPRLSASGRNLSIEDDQLRLGTGRVRFGLQGYDAVDFPPSADFSGQDIEAYDINIEALRWATRAAAHDDSRPILTGVCIAENGTIASSDGFRLKVYGEFDPSARQIVVPSRPIELAPNDCSQILIKGNRTQCRLDGAHSLTVQLIQGTFPNYANLIPSDAGIEWTAEFDRPVLFAAANYISNWMRVAGGSGILRLNVSPDDVCLSARSEEVGDVEMHVACKTEGKGKVALNVRYFLDALTCSKEKVLIKGYGAQLQVAFKYDDRIDIAMPMFVQW